ncbi:MAG: Tat pathway signal protein [Halobacteriales archaeon]
MARSIPRRQFLKTAVAIGGASALSACLDRESDLDLKTGVSDPSTLPSRQHAWNDALETDDHGNHVPPSHRVLLYLDYAGEGLPDDADRETLSAALGALEGAYARTAEGLFATISYSPGYFDRFGVDLPDSVDLPGPTALTPLENPAFDTPDALVHLASNYASVVLGAEEALLGETDELNGVEISESLDGVFDRVDRRTGFIGEGLPADNQDVEGIPDSEPVPEESPLFMGFESGMKKAQASEDRVTISEGPFAGGTTQQVSKITLNLDQWYEQDSRSHRVASMFCPAHANKGLVEGTGENLGNTNGVAENGCPAHAVEDAREEGVVGHAQKAGRAREDGDPIILRRDFDSTDDDRASVHFLSLQREIADFVGTRTAMTGSDIAETGGVGRRSNNGILRYMTVQRRGNFLLPPREHRAFPTPRPE